MRFKIGITLVVISAAVFLLTLVAYGLKHWSPWAALLLLGFSTGLTEDE